MPNLGRRFIGADINRTGVPARGSITLLAASMKGGSIEPPNLLGTLRRDQLSSEPEASQPARATSRFASMKGGSIEPPNLGIEVRRGIDLSASMKGGSIEPRTGQATGDAHSHRLQ